jgi:diguanylate cyclase (GGDEF)-like protein
LGGEEFLVFLPRTNLNHAAQVAERIRKAIAKYPWHTVIDEKITLTTSIGVSELKPDDSVNTLVKRADDALYRGKEAGRNWVELESEASCRKPKTASSSPSG